MRHFWQRLLLMGALCACLPALSQTTTARLQGVVRDAQGPLPGVTVAAVNTENGLRRATVTGTDGSYALTVPPGPYNLTAGTPAHQEQTQPIRVQVGQTVEQNFELQPGKMVAQAVSVSAELTPEVQSTEVATNVSRQQIESLPQINRNFLNFVVLAPGARVSHDELRQEISYGAQGATNTNVFIDGTSFKNDVTQGGSVGQDASRGNPFPQNAVQEYRVITQNYKAEYQKASSVIISAVTKSGTNDYHGDAFFYYQNKNLVAQDKFTQAQGVDKPEYTRYQPGVSLGGPLVKDKLFFFFSYEGNYQNRENSVLLGTDSTWPQAFRSQFQKYVGNFPSDFRASLAFGKISANLSEGSTLDFSGDFRHETDIRDFGGQTSDQSADNLKNDVGSARIKHTGIFGKLLNEATLGYQKFRWNPVPEDNSLVGQNYFGLMQIGSNSTFQDISQARYSVRDDLTLTSLQAGGDHTIKGGITFDYLQYHVTKNLNGVPTFNFRSDTFNNTPGDMPFEAFYGFGNPDLSTNNKQFGVYLQDDWRITPRLTANIGLRWDFETDMLNNNYVTPAVIAQGFKSVYPSNYFTDGSQRPTDYGAVQPRIGLTFDLTGAGKTIAYAGYGKYYDRTLYNDILDEKFRLQWPVYHFFFSKDGSPQGGNPAIKWDPSYLSQNGLNNLIANGTAPPPEIYLLNNDTKPPSSDQWSAGLRHNFGAFSASVGYMNVHSRDQLTWTCGIKDANGNCDFGARPAASLGLGFSLLSRAKQSWYQSIQVQLDKPWTSTSKWAGTLSYVYGDAKQTGNDLFSFGDHDPAYGIQQRSPAAQKHTITASAVVGLPFDFRFGTLITLGSGFPFFVNDCSTGYSTCVENIGGGDPPKWTESIDFRLEKNFVIGGSYSVGLIAEVINAFNFSNEQGYDNFINALPNVNTNFGHPSSAYNPRRVQFGAKFSF
jgi:Carboxypeptidase regulatory-like domain/TonB dependent receptor